MHEGRLAPGATPAVTPEPHPPSLEPVPARPVAAFVNPVLDTGADRDHGDPFVLRWRGRYHLYYTGSAGIEVWTGTDLVHWTHRGQALVAPAGDHWAQVDLWAPEVMYADGWFYLYVTGTRHHPAGPRSGTGVDGGDDGLRRQGVARARDPLGPFVLDDAPLLDVWSIDGHPFVDADGRRWLFYNVRDASTRYQGVIPGCGNLVDELVAPDAVRGTPTPVTLPDEAWEGNRGGTWYWNEGPTVLRRRGRYVQMYSGGWYGDATYGIGYAVADTPRGPWRKAETNPVFVSGGRITGPGHHCVVVGPDGVTPYAVYHAYVDGERGRKVHVDRLHWSTEGPRLGSGELPGRPTEGPQLVPDAAVHDPAVPAWHAEMWVRGSTARFGDLVVELPAGRDALLDVTHDGHELRVLLDGRLVAAVAPAAAPAPIAAALEAGTAVDGQVLSLALTSWREDQRVHRLGPGDRVEVPWGGDHPVELSVAVTGAAAVRLLRGERTVADVDGVGVGAASGATARLVRLRTGAPVDRVEITAGPAGAVVSDLVLVARPPAAARPDAAPALPPTGEIPLPRDAAES